MVVNPLKGMVVGLSLVKAGLTEVKVSTDLAVVARPLQGKHVAAMTPGKLYIFHEMLGKSIEASCHTLCCYHPYNLVLHIYPRFHTHNS